MDSLVGAQFVAVQIGITLTLIFSTEPTSIFISILVFLAGLGADGSQ
jgi:hypothetical protein